ncbi:tRNA pseudouridine(65) synthase TruC [Neisseria leonii]|uniref:tRNA pseudouridine(65) synthase TruC n=1 Tax=Neisseria leonii TaxID=2995413 RepID=UPI0030CBE013
MLDILYRDDDCIAVNKPAGMLVHRSWISSSESVFVMQTLRDQIGQHVFPVHRLDRPTSGVLLFALNSSAARYLSLQFERHETVKRYWAVVRGWPREDSGRIDYPLTVILDKIADIHAAPDKIPQTAVTDWRVLARSEQPFQSALRYPTSRYAWLELTPHTGRKHQLRRHLKHIFHPIVGDTNYGDLRQNHAVARHTGIRRLMLHARSLQFNRPDNGRPCTITAPPDNAWQDLMQSFGWPADG